MKAAPWIAPFVLPHVYCTTYESMGVYFKIFDLIYMDIQYIYSVHLQAHVVFS